MDHAFLVLCICKEQCLVQLLEEIQDKINADAPDAALLVDTGLTKRRQQGYFLLLLMKDASSTFKSNVIASLQDDEDVMEIIKFPISRLLERVLPLFSEDERQESDDPPSTKTRGND